MTDSNHQSSGAQQEPFDPITAHQVKAVSFVCDAIFGTRDPSESTAKEWCPVARKWCACKVRCDESRARAFDAALDARVCECGAVVADEELTCSACRDVYEHDAAEERERLFPRSEP